MPLKLETYNRETKSWIEVGVLHPGSYPGSISNISQGSRQIYLFECAKDDSHSAIYRSLAGVDIEEGITREVISTRFVKLMELKRRESYVLEVKTDKSPEKRPIKFTHI